MGEELSFSDSREALPVEEARDDTAEDEEVEDIEGNISSAELKVRRVRDCHDSHWSRMHDRRERNRIYMFPLTGMCPDFPLDFPIFHGEALYPNFW